MAASKGRPWDEQEALDLHNLTQAEFRSKYPDRSERSYYVRCYKEKIEVSTHDALLKQKRLLLGTATAEQIEEPNALVLLEAMKTIQREVRKLEVEQHDVPVHLSGDRPIGIVFTSDWHIGSEGCDYEQLEKDLDTIANNPYLYAYVGGDGVDNFVLQQMVEATRSQLVKPPVQWFLFEHYLRRLAGSIIAVGKGNHDDWTEKLTGIDRVADIAKAIKTVYTGSGGMLRLGLGEQLYKIFRVHKYRYNSSFNVTHSAKQLYKMGPEPFDVGVTEHVHTAAGETAYLHGEQKIFLVCGTYKVFDKWAQFHGFFGAKVLNPTVVFWPDTKRMELRMDLASVGKELMRM